MLYIIKVKTKKQLTSFHTTLYFPYSVDMGLNPGSAYSLQLLDSNKRVLPISSKYQQPSSQIDD